MELVDAHHHSFDLSGSGDGRTPAERAAILAGTAIRVYRLDTLQPERT
jgi:hypothetical protein